MKTLKTILLLTIVISLNSSMTFAGGAGSITSVVDGQSIVLSSEEQAMSQVKVQLTDQEGLVLISEKIELNDLINRKYNLRNLPDGIYDLQITDEEKIITKRMFIDRESLSIIDESKLIKPRFFVKNNVVTVSLLPFGEKAVIRIYDEAGSVLIEDSFKNKNAVSKKYDFSGSRIGQYTMVVMIKGEVFRKPINIFI